jgi:TPP-dependent pyruvate/acetoin dehydrogenase alpha subunit
MDKRIRIDLLKKMILLRYFDSKISELFKKGFIKGSVHTYLGQEAIASAICMNLLKDDYIISSHRSHGHIIAKGGDLKKVFSEILGRADGYSGGRGGSMHLISKDVKIISFPIVGAGLPIGIGIAQGFKRSYSKNIVVVFFGDGASNQGTFHESLNLASIFDLPVLFVCENNKYAVSSDINKMVKIKNISMRAKSYGIEGLTVDGNNAEKMYEISKDLINKIRDGKGPILLEAITYRWEGHYTGEPCVYRSKKETQEWITKCPITKLKNCLLKEEVITGDDILEIEDNIKEQVENALSFAIKSKEPEENHYKDYVYKE